jgi:molybdopterin-containing oxidoreductase family iron-sulfur binding subunit
MRKRGKETVREKKVSRRSLLKGTALAAAAAAFPPVGAEASVWEAFFQKHFQELNARDMEKVITRLEKEYADNYGKEMKVSATEPLPGVLFGYGLDISRCIGCRRCVYACVEENNQSREPQIHWITVLRFKKGDKWVNDLESADKYYNPDKVPEPGSFYMPTQCQQCENPPCVKACPTQATWSEDDGIVVVDYNWCIGCRYCMAACPYGARHFNWTKPGLRAEEINTETHYLGNRPRYNGVVEKCTFCIQRTRKEQGQYPACVEICPVGARKFGNLLDPESEIRYCIENKRIFRLKEDLNTHPKFFYFFAT